jgi:hypothetical protein
VPCSSLFNTSSSFCWTGECAWLIADYETTGPAGRDDHLFEPLSADLWRPRPVEKEMDGHAIVDPQGLSTAADVSRLSPTEHERFSPSELGGNDELEVSEQPVVEIEALGPICEFAHCRPIANAVV